jgi:hypothetical protein
MYKYLNEESEEEEEPEAHQPPTPQNGKYKIKSI